MKPDVKAFFDSETSTLTYVVFDPQTKDAVIIDPVWNYDMAASKLSSKSVDEVKEFVSARGLCVHLLMETHAHADHITGAQILKASYPHAKLVIGEHIRDVQKHFASFYNLPKSFVPDGHQFDMLLADQSMIHAGSLAIKTIFTPGHTPACTSYLIEDAVFTGDALFTPDYGTGRCDFPLGSAADLFNSVQRLYQLPDSTRTFTCHDYQPGGRKLLYESTIGEHKRTNIHLKSTTTKAEFVAFREKRDASLSLPRLLLASIQINMCAGQLPDAESNHTRYLKIPLTVEKATFKSALSSKVKSIPYRGT